MIKDTIIKIKLLFRKDKELYSQLKNIIGFYPHNIYYYKIAFMHKSIRHHNEKGRPLNNERLEFLGDAVLDAVVGDIVFKHFPGKREGFLTNTRSKIVQRETLGKLATELGINKLVKKTQQSNSHNSYLNGNAFEALVGAIYLDRGYDHCMKFVKEIILKKMINIDKMANKEVNFKSKLLELSQKKHFEVEFRLLEETLDDKSSPTFKYIVLLNNQEFGVGKGYSKKEAQQKAAKKTLDLLKGGKVVEKSEKKEENNDSFPQEEEENK